MRGKSQITWMPLALLALALGCSVDSKGSMTTFDGVADSVPPDTAVDGTVDGVTDTEPENECTSDPECDDDDPCTDDVCLEGVGCVHEHNTAACDDGNPCTSPDVCDAGVCNPGPGVCECETDGDCAAHDDDDLCNGTLFCDVDLCAIDPATIVTCPPGADCAPLVCVPATGDCVATDAPAGTACEDDGDLCTADTCDGSGECLHDTIYCFDDEQCTTDSCFPASGCVFTAISGSCEDGNVCTDNDLCFGGLCTAGSPLDCEDGDPCTTNACVDPVGCTSSFNTDPCEDGNPCTGPDTCNGAGGCSPGPPVAVWYLDSDGDDYGLDSDTVCSPTRPSGYAPDGGDCCDTLSSVNPGATAWFSVGYFCPGGTGTEEWDYDCDGSVTRRWNVVRDCDDSSGTCVTTPGWDVWNAGDIPNYGITERYILTCGGSGCWEDGADNRAQSCR